MTDECIIQADYVNWRPIPSRKVLELRFEVDISLQSEVLAYLGAPATDKSIPCAIALLDLKPKQAEVQAEHSEAAPPKKWNEYARSQQAYLLCRDPAFWRYFGDTINNPVPCESALKAHFRIESKSEFDQPENHARWDEFVALFHLHRDRLK